MIEGKALVGAFFLLLAVGIFIYFIWLDLWKR